MATLRTMMLSRILICALFVAATAFCIGHVAAQDVGAQPPAVAPKSGQSTPAQPSGKHRSRPAQSVLGPPPIEFRPEILDLGTLRPNQRTTGRAQLLNVSEKWLKVLAVKPDCSCTSATVSSDVMGPGQSIFIEAEYHANKGMGPTKSAVRVLVEGYDVIELPIRAYIALTVRADPPYIHALPDQDGRIPVTGEYTVSAADQRPFRILAVNGSPPYFVDFNPLNDEPRASYRLKWDLSEYNEISCRNEEGRKMPGWLIIETDHPDTPIFDLEIRHKCNARELSPQDTWTIQERRVMLGALEPGKPVEFDVVVKWFPRRPRTDLVTTALAESRQFSVELLSVGPAEDGLLCRLRLTPASDHQGLLQGPVRLHAHRQSAPVMIIGTVRSAD